MWNVNLYLVLGCILQAHSSLAIWQCSTDTDCATLVGSVCTSGACICPDTQQIVASGTQCADLTSVSTSWHPIWQCSTDCATLVGSVCISGSCICPDTQQIVASGTQCADHAPYLTSACVDDFQCSRLFTAFQCRRNEDQAVGNCFCQPNHHYFRGRCWPTHDLGETCTRDEECMGVIRDPYSMTCQEQTCQCAEGYYNRQRGECRKIGAAIGDRCVINEDCQFTDGVCDPLEFICYDANNPAAHISMITKQNATSKMAAPTMVRVEGATCSAISPCPTPFECSSWGQCICPLGYYGSADGTACFAELGSPSTEAQCVGLLAEVQNGVCTCPANFFFDEGMRDCTKVARRITDFCFNDDQCHTFGAASFCGEPGQWGLRICDCDQELAVWDAQRSMCRLFAGIGEPCQVNSDCMAGELEITCALNDEDEGYCACPDGLTESDGLCLTTGLELGDACQVTQECTATQNTVCEAGRCSCDNGYQEVEDSCFPIIGGTCSVDDDCVIQDTVCVEGDAGWTCQCRTNYTEYDDACWPISSGYNANCTVDAQCMEFLGSSASCQEGVCLCGDNFHYRHNACWRMTGLFEPCSFISECFLGELTDVVVCRNGLCQCDFYHPYDEERHTCTSSAGSLSSGLFIVITTLAYLYS